jgi:DNA polymerase-3 subunit alpha
VLPPDVNFSQVDFSIENRDDKEKPAIRFGLAAVKNVGKGAVNPIIAERNKNGLFKSIEDFCRRLDPQSSNRRVLESLIKAGALDCLGNRGALLNSLERLLSMAQTEVKLRSSGQSTMFDLFGQSSPIPLPSLELAERDVTDKEKLVWEKELMGVYLSEHPFARYAKHIDTENTILPSQINTELEGQSMVLVGMVDSVRELSTKDHRLFCAAQIADDVAVLEVMVWARIYEDTKELWKEGNFLRIEGKVKIREERVQFTCDAVEIYKPDDAVKPTRLLVEKEGASGKKKGNGTNGKTLQSEPNGKPAIAMKNGENGTTPVKQYKLILTLFETAEETKDIELYNKVIETIKEYRGRDEVYLRVVNTEHVTNMKINGLFTDASPDLKKRLAQILGPGNVKTENIDEA